ncbi:enoyl-CoA hydratase/isomerase family protein [Streptomyces sp. NPDC059256]|uniref:enoyl-CoA hydratase/isomerase family protein n=1 Tax=Streptomyces sp. NPDC059256 TaxID=3346794 RepID=UPI0036A0E1F9
MESPTQPSTPPRVTHSVTDGVATVVISNPAKRNAMTGSMWRELAELLGPLAGDRDVRALVLTGEGATFCAGADIAALRGTGESSQSLATRAEEALAAFPKPTLAAVRGHCVGGGCQLAAACDLRFAEEGALFGVTPARLGIVYPSSSTRRLVSLTGLSAAKYLLFSAELIDTDRALRTGLVDEVVPTGRLGQRVAAFTRTLAARSQLTQAAAKEFAAGRVDRDAYWAEQARSADEATEGVAAFLERRAPRFTWTLPEPAPELRPGDLRHR